MNKIKLSNDTWVFDEGGVRFFLLIGTERALMIDSGMKTRNAKELAEEITSLPIELINTHADRDHTASNAEFARFYMSPAECSNYYRSGGTGEFEPIRDGDEIDLGDRKIRVIETPGHTPGSIALLDLKTRRIFTGDPIQDGRIFMFGVQREMHAYLCSLERVEQLSGEFDEIYPSHGSFPLKADIIPKLMAAAEKKLSGEAEPTEEQVFGNTIKAYDMGVATFLCD